MRQNAVGFTVPESYFRVPFRQRTKATVVNHSEKFPRTPREEFCIAQGWELELNVPLVRAGEADGALVICRRRRLSGVGDVVDAVAPILKHLDTIERLSKENPAEARRTMDELRIDPFGPGDLASALERCIRQVLREHRFAVSLQLDEYLPPVRRYVKVELCRIVLEAVTNSRKHARSDSARVVARRKSGGFNHSNPGRGTEVTISWTP